MSASVPESRSYVHAACGQVTDVDGGEFKVVASPVPGITMTMCAACGRHFPAAEFRWEDTHEDLPTYYARHRANVPALSRWLASSQAGNVMLVLGALAGVALGAWAWMSLGIVWGIVIGIAGVLGGLLAGLLVWDRLGARLLCSALGVSDVRCLK